MQASVQTLRAAGLKVGHRNRIVGWQRQQQSTEDKPTLPEVTQLGAVIRNAVNETQLTQFQSLLKRVSASGACSSIHLFQTAPRTWPRLELTSLACVL